MDAVEAVLKQLYEQSNSEMGQHEWQVSRAKHILASGQEHSLMSLIYAAGIYQNARQDALAEKYAGAALQYLIAGKPHQLDENERLRWMGWLRRTAKQLEPSLRPLPEQASQLRRPPCSKCGDSHIGGCLKPRPPGRKSS